MYLASPLEARDCKICAIANVWMSSSHSVAVPRLRFLLLAMPALNHQPLVPLSPHVIASMHCNV